MSTADRVRAGFWRACCRLASAMTYGGSSRAEALPLPLADEPPEGRRAPFADTVAGWHSV
jgi:hypothetical protein